MIESLSELNDVVNQIVNRIVETSTQRTSTGNWIMEYDDFLDLIDEQDYYQYFDLIANELLIRPEVLDLDTSNHQFDAIYGLKYCPNYEWCEGDEEIFGCDQAQWERTFRAEPVSQPLSMSRMAEIGEQAVAHILETSDIAIDDLTENVGMSLSELHQLGLYNADPDIVQVPIHFEVFDVQQVRTYPCDNVQDALKIYKGLGDSPFKFIAAVIPPGMPHHGRLMFMHQQDGKDVLLNADTESPKLKTLHEQFAGTVVEDAFTAVARYVKSQTPIAFFVWDDHAAYGRMSSFATFEEALARYQAIPREEKMLSYLVYDEQGRGTGGLLLQRTAHKGDMVCDISESALETNPHIALAASKARLSLFPNDEQAWAMRDQAEAALGITERMVNTDQDLLAGKWRVHIVPPGGRYGSHNHLLNQDKPLVEFYDMNCDTEKFGPSGQLVTRYYLDTLLGRDGWSTGYFPKGLALDASVPAWTVSAEEMQQVVKHLRAWDAQQAHKHPSLASRIDIAQSKTPSPMQSQTPERTPEH